MGRAQNTHAAGSARRRQRNVSELPVGDVRALVAAAAPRVAALGNWPAYIPAESILARLPSETDPATGFDAGVACALDLIPRSRQRLAACLHAAYTPEAVAQVRAEAARMDADSETTWWLAACSVCTEGKLTEQDFLGQLAQFEALATDPAARRSAALSELAHMTASFSEVEGVAFGRVDGCMQGAYVAGYDVAAMYAPDSELYFVGTLRPSLGLDEFRWEQPPNPEGASRDEQLGRSGPVHGSRQFVKAASEAEYRLVVSAVRDALGEDALRRQGPATYAAVEVETGELPSSFEAGGARWQTRPRLHVSLFTGDRHVQAVADRHAESVTAATERIAGALTATERQLGRPSSVSFTGDFRVAETDDGRRSLLAMCDVDGLGTYTAALAARLGVPIQVPPAHVTIATAPGGRSIGVTSAAELQQRTRRLSLDQVPASLRAAFTSHDSA